MTAGSASSASSVSSTAAGAPPLHLVVMGVAGCGKSAVGALVAARLGLPLVEGDDFHPAANIVKMRRGQPLDDADRAEWLVALAGQLRERPAGCVLTCSALKRAYRDTLRSGAAGLRFVHLSLTPPQALQRVAARTDHFYPPSLVASQFEALEDPRGEPRVLAVDAASALPDIAAQVERWLAAAP